MNDLIRALQIAVMFGPTKSTGMAPGLDVVLFEFPEEGHAHIYSTDGRMMVKLILSGVGVTGDHTYFYTAMNDIDAVVTALRHAPDVTLSIWGDTLMFMAGDEVLSVVRAPNAFPDGHQASFFDVSPSKPCVVLDAALLESALKACRPVMEKFKRCGPLFMFQPQTHRSGETQTLVTPRIRPDMDQLRSIEIIIMAVKE